MTPSFPSPAAVAPPSVAVPWWRVGTVWLVVGGPAAAVVAGIATTVIAYAGADPVLDGADRAQSRVVPAADLRTGARAVAIDAAKAPTAPALAGRNHAATPPAGR